MAARLSQIVRCVPNTSWSAKILFEERRPSNQKVAWKEQPRVEAASNITLLPNKNRGVEEVKNPPQKTIWKTIWNTSKIFQIVRTQPQVQPAQVKCQHNSSHFWPPTTLFGHGHANGHSQHTDARLLRDLGAIGGVIRSEIRDEHTKNDGKSLSNGKSEYI